MLPPALARLHPPRRCLPPACCSAQVLALKLAIATAPLFEVNARTFLQARRAAGSEGRVHAAGAATCVCACSPASMHACDARQLLPPPAAAAAGLLQGEPGQAGLMTGGAGLLRVLVGNHAALLLLVGSTCMMGMWATAVTTLFFFWNLLQQTPDLCDTPVRGAGVGWPGDARSAAAACLARWRAALPRPRTRRRRSTRSALLPQSQYMRSAIGSGFLLRAAKTPVVRLAGGGRCSGQLSTSMNAGRRCAAPSPPRACPPLLAPRRRPASRL